MKNMSIYGRIAVFVVAIFMAVSLAGCGGGGGGGNSSTPSTTAITVICPNGSSQTDTTSALAWAKCDLGKVTSVTPANGAIVQLDFPGIVVKTDSTLNLTDGQKVPATADNPIAGTISKGADGKSFTLVPDPLSPGAYTINHITFPDTLNRQLDTGKFSFTVSSCKTGTVVGSDGKSCVPVAAPTAIVSSYSPTTGATGVTVGMPSTISLATTNATSVDATKVSLTCGGKVIPITVTSPLGSNGVATITMTPAAGAEASGDTCRRLGPVTTTGPGGSVVTNLDSSYFNAVPVPPVPTATVSSYAPANGATGVTVGSEVDVVLAVTHATGSDASKASLTCGGKVIPVSSSALLSADGTTVTIKMIPTTGVEAAGDACVVGGSVTTTGPGGNADVAVNTSYTVAAPVAWWPPTFVPKGVKVYLDSTKAPTGAVVNAIYPGQTQSGLLPAACAITGDDCWKEAVRNGTIKFIATPAVDANQPTRPIVFGFYKTVSTINMPGAMMYCSKPFYADDGALYAANDPVEDRCSPDEGIYLVGDNQGALLQERNSQTGVNACFQKSDSVQYNGWLTTEAVCP